jgi:hypothetical protein
MQPTAELRFDELVEQTLGQGLPHGMAASVCLSKLPVESQDFILRMLVLMKKAGYPVTAFTPHLIHWLSVTVPSTLPGAWSGRIPPLTLPGRHKKLDAYVADWAKRHKNGRRLFIDVGCGFPPVTSVDTANRFPGWEVYGIDRTFADYVLYDSEGHYACFDQTGRFLYFQALMNASGRALYADPQATRNRFNALFADLQPLLQDTNSTKSESAEKEGSRLIHHHIRDFEAANLTFINSDLMDLDLPPAAVIRCMNVFIYYGPEKKTRMLEQAGNLLVDGGILIVGTNGLGVQTRYAVYRKVSQGLVVDEFAFGLDNVGHIVFMPFFSIHENDPEASLLAELAGILRADPGFGPDFGKRQDELLNQHGICHRNPDGFFVFPNDGMSPAEYLKINARIWRQLREEGYTDRAVHVLQQAGFESWKNPVGDVAIRPRSGAFANGSS